MDREQVVGKAMSRVEQAQLLKHVNEGAHEGVDAVIELAVGGRSIRIKATKREIWGRMAIVDTKPFKLRVILHRIFVERPQVTGIPAWPGGAACYRRSRYIL